MCPDEIIALDVIPEISTQWQSDSDLQRLTNTNFTNHRVCNSQKRSQSKSIITRIFQELYLSDGYCIQDLVNKIVRIVLTTLPLHCISICCVNITKQSGNSPTMLCYIFITGILRVKVNLLSAELYDTVTAERSSASTPNKTVICPSLPPSSHVSIYRLNIPTSQPVFMFQYHGWT